MCNKSRLLYNINESVEQVKARSIVIIDRQTTNINNNWRIVVINRYKIIIRLKSLFVFYETEYKNNVYNMSKKILPLLLFFSARYIQLNILKLTFAFSSKRRPRDDNILTRCTTKT